MNKLHRKDMRGPDAFQAGVERFLAQVAPYGRHIAVGFVALVVAGLALWGVQVQRDQALKAYNAQLTEAFRAYERAFVAQIRDGTADWEPVAVAFSELYDRAPHDRARVQALFYLFHISLESGNLTKAEAQLNELRGLAGGDPTLLAYAYYAQALLKERQGNRRDALAALDQAAAITPNPLGAMIESERERLAAAPLDPALVARFASPVSAAASAAP